MVSGLSGWSRRTGETRESAGRECGQERDESWSGESGCVCRNVLFLVISLEFRFYFYVKCV